MSRPDPSHVIALCLVEDDAQALLEVATAVLALLETPAAFAHRSALVSTAAQLTGALGR